VGEEEDATEKKKSQRERGRESERERDEVRRKWSEVLVCRVRKG
jgi:hypothetical protein